jgi:hypothetical protein
VAVGRMFGDDDEACFASLHAELPTDSASEPFPPFVCAHRQEASEASGKH